VDFLTAVSLPIYSQTRSEPRYRLRLPVQLTAAGANGSEIIGLSENISAHGALLLTETPLAEDARLRLAIVVGPPGSSKVTRLSASGKVLRVERRATGGFAIAVWCNRPFRMMSQSMQTTID